MTDGETIQAAIDCQKGRGFGDGKDADQVRTGYESVRVVYT